MEGADVMERVRPWLTHRIRRQTLLCLALLLIIFGSLVYGVAGAVRGIERELLWPIVWIGLPVGWGLACSRMPGWQAAVVSLLLGAVLVVVRVGQLGDLLATLLGELASTVWQTVQGSFWPDVTPIQLAWAELGSAAGALIARLYTWLLGLAHGQELFDPVPVALLWGVALWGTVVWASWAVRRLARAVWGVVPAAALLASTLAYVGGRALYLLPILAATLVLKALVGHDTRRKRWEQAGVRYPRRVRSDTAWMALGLSVALALIAAITPSISVYGIVDFARSLAPETAEREELGDSLGLEQQPEPLPANLSILDARRSGSLPTRHLLGSGPELSKQVAMVVSIEPTHPEVPQPTVAEPLTAMEAPEQPAPSYYWRGLTYDRYTDRGWFAEYAGRVRYEAGEPANPASAPNQQMLRQSVRVVEDRNELLYMSGSLVTADRDYQVAWRSRPREEGIGDAFGALIQGVAYRVDSLLPVFGETGLRAAGQDYPAWVVERYLALPDSVPDRVLALARDLTASQLTPYDRALAIERYLRRFPYTLDLPSPPTDQDITDYFLFDLKKGYCDYYATAMVVLARATGLPARLVTGYASGTYDKAEARYVVTEADAHAWVEVYFPGYGWIEFEPTAGRPVIERPADAVLDVPPELDVAPEPITAHRNRVRWAWWLGAGGGGLVLALVSIAAWSLADGWRLRRMPPTAAVAALYRRLYRYGRWLGVLSQEGDTPREFTATVARRLSDLAESRRWGRFLFCAADEMGLLTELCIRALYSLHEPQAEDRVQAIQAWGRLRRRLWLARLLTLKGRGRPRWGCLDLSANYEGGMENG